MVEAAFVTHFPIPPIYPYLPFTPGYLIPTCTETRMYLQKILCPKIVLAMLAS